MPVPGGYIEVFDQNENLLLNYLQNKMLVYRKQSVKKPIHNSSKDHTEPSEFNVWLINSLI